MTGAFYHMPGRDKLALLAAWPLICLTAIFLRLFGFRPLAQVLGAPVGPNAFVRLVDPMQAERARLVKRAIRRAARIAPGRADCLPQMLAGAVMCRMLSVPTTAFLGVKLGSDPQIVAHAWLCAGPVPVTGGASFEEFAVTLCFSTSDPTVAPSSSMQGRRGL